MEVQYWEMAKFVAVPLAVVVTQKFFDYKNARAHDAINLNMSNLAGDLSKVISHLELDVENSDYIAKMGDVKSHYISLFKRKPFQVAANKKANMFIAAVAKAIQDHPEMDPASWTQVAQDFDTGYEEVRKMMESHIKPDATKGFYVDHAVAYAIYKANIEAIFMGLANSRKERFIKLSNDFTVQFLVALGAHEKACIKAKIKS